MNDKTLKLSQSYEPIGIIGWKKAVRLIVLGKAEVLKEYDREGRTATVVFKFPAVIRLVKTFPRSKNRIRFSKQNVFARDRWQCGYCKRKFQSSDLTMDHVLPKARGGRTVFENIVTCCKECNFKKKDKTPQEAGMHLGELPVTPDYIPMFIFGLSKMEMPEVWRDFCYLSP